MIRSLRVRVDRLAANVPPTVSTEDAAAFHAARLARIAAEPPGPRRELLIKLTDAGMRARARMWKAPVGLIDSITTMVRAQIASLKGKG
jgi:hypothetical protein